MHYKIRENLYLSAIPKNTEEISIYSHILNVSTNYNPPYNVGINQKYLHIPLMDIDDISPYLENLIDFIENAVKKGKILVHCIMGLNRSPSCIIAYLSSSEKRNPTDCLLEMKSINPAIEVFYIDQICQFLGYEYKAIQDPLLTFHQRLKVRINQNSMSENSE